jgi:glycosyltransferase involved in cell wall biosynthesis
MAMGLPVVATSVAAKGIQAIPNEQLFVADDPESFAEQVIRALQDPTLRNTLSGAGRKRVKAVHDWTVSMLTLDDILTSRGLL